MPLFKIVETDNFGGDYPDEKFLNLPAMHKQFAERIAAEINQAFCGVISTHPRYWKVVPTDYQLQPGFEP